MFLALCCGAKENHPKGKLWQTTEAFRGVREKLNVRRGNKVIRKQSISRFYKKVQRSRRLNERQYEALRGRKKEWSGRRFRVDKGGLVRRLVSLNDFWSVLKGIQYGG